MKTKAMTKKRATRSSAKPPKPVSRRTNPPRGAKQARPPSPPPDEYAAVTDPTAVHGPVTESVHSSLTKAYRVNKNLPMCFIFDYISPGRLFKRGTMFREKAKSFPQWTPEELAEATETDDVDGKTGIAKLMPFDPKPYTYVNHVNRSSPCY